MENNKQSSIDILMKSILESDVELYISMQESGEFEQIKAMHKEEIESNNKINLAINEFRKWNEEWMANPSIKVRSLKSVDEFAENLSEKYTLIKKKQSSIDWLVQQIWKNEPLEHEQKVIEQAKAMHKEEMANTWIKACEDILSALENDTVASFSSKELFNQYYNETFGGNNE